MHFGEQLAGSADGDQGLPARGYALGQVEQQVGVDADQTGGVFRPLQVAGHPVDIFGNARKH